MIWPRTSDEREPETWGTSLDMEKQVRESGVSDGRVFLFNCKCKFRSREQLTGGRASFINMAFKDRSFLSAR